MREIIFRGKRKDNGEWVYGDLIHYACNNGDVGIDNAFLVEDENDIETFDIIPETIGQYTGLTDKNGKKIFEGDILKAKTLDTNSEQIAVVGFGNFVDENNDDEYLGFYIEFNGIKTTATQLFLEEVKCRIEVISNIHDNPELLKGGD